MNEARRYVWLRGGEGLEVRRTLFCFDVEEEI